MATPILASATPFIALCALACPVGMGAMMWFMTRGSRSQPSHPPTQVESPQDACAEAESRDGSAQGVTAAGARDTLGR